MKKIKVRFAKGDVVVLQQQNDSDETNRVFITRRELNSLIDFFRSPKQGRFGFYCTQAEPLVITFDDRDFSYVIERDGVAIYGVRYPEGLALPQVEPESEPPNRPAIFGFMEFIRRGAS